MPTCNACKTLIKGCACQLKKLPDGRKVCAKCAQQLAPETPKKAEVPRVHPQASTKAFKPTISPRVAPPSINKAMLFK